MCERQQSNSNSRRYDTHRTTKGEAWVADGRAPAGIHTRRRRLARRKSPRVLRSESTRRVHPLNNLHCLRYGKDGSSVGSVRKSFGEPCVAIRRESPWFSLYAGDRLHSAPDCRLSVFPIVCEARNPVARRSGLSTPAPTRDCKFWDDGLRWPTRALHTSITRPTLV